MDLDHAIQYGMAIILAALGYIAGVLKMLHSKNEIIAKDLTSHKVEVARDYVPRVEMQRLEQRIEGRFDKIEGRFDKMEIWIGRRFDMVMGRHIEEKTE